MVNNKSSDIVNGLKAEEISVRASPIESDGALFYLCEKGILRCEKDSEALDWLRYGRFGGNFKHESGWRWKRYGGDVYFWLLCGLGGLVITSFYVPSYILGFGFGTSISISFSIALALSILLIFQVERPKRKYFVIPQPGRGEISERKWKIPVPEDEERQIILYSNLILTGNGRSKFAT